MYVKFKFFIFLGIILLVYSCERKNSDVLINEYLKDSIEFYNKSIKSSTISDSLKKKLNDKAYKLNKSNNNDSIRIKNNDTIAYNYYKLNYFDDYQKVVKSNYFGSLQQKDTNRIIKSTINYGHYYLRRNNYDSAFYYFDKSQKLYIVNNQVDNSNELSIEKASIQFYQGDYLGSETTILKSLSYFKKKNEELKLITAYTILGLCKMELNEYNESIGYFRLASDLSKKYRPDNSTDPILLNNLALVYFKKEQYKTAIQYYNQIINSINVKSNNHQAYTFAKQFLTYSKFKLGDSTNFEKEYDEILKNYKELNLSTIQPLIQLSEYYESQKNIKKSQELALEAYAISAKENLYRDKLIAIKQLTNVFPEQSKYYSNKYIKLSDSIAAVDKKVQNTFARIEYRVDELNDENLLLEEKNKQIIFYSLIAVLIVVLLFGFSYQKQKQREFLLVQEQQKTNEEVYSLMINQQSQMDKVKVFEQKRISQELHDGILGKLFGARMNLDFVNSQQTGEIKNEKQKYIQEIIDVEKQIRQISHELSDEKRAIINNYQLLLDRFVEDQQLLLKLKINYFFNKKVPWEFVTAEEKINLYRIIQESFQNINKYSDAKTVMFSFEYLNNKLKIIILDDGKGFNIRKHSKGIGIKNMKDRAKLINVVYKIDSEIDKGTKTQIILDINTNKEF